MRAQDVESPGQREEDGKVLERWRHVAVGLLLATLAFMQDPGRIVADTKIDLPLNPGGLMERALSLWEPLGFAGQVQNQGYGYLFPMGPFFWIGDVLGVPDWVWQRLWWALILFAAYLGASLLARALGIGTPATRLVAGLAYALAPRMISTIGPISSETLAMAVAPWVLLPLVVGARSGRLARGGLLSGVALLFAGGVNAAATLVLCVAPALYLLTRHGGAARRRLAGWWALGTVLACIWWLGPLLILRAVSPPFLDYIEDASVTTRFASLPQALRGTEHWLGYLVDSGGPVWRSGWFLVTVPVVIAYTSLVAALGLAGVALRSMPERTFVALLTLAGVVLVTFGYVGSVDGIVAEWARSLLDGPLVAFRNTHKFDPVLRMAIVLGLAHFLGRAFDLARGREGWRPVPYAVTALALLGVVGTAFPGFVGQMAPRGSFTSVPDYWQEAIDYLEAGTTDGGRVLLAPGTSFATYLWGAPRDEPIQALGEVPWLTRDAIPLTPPATIRMLDALQTRWASGRPAPGIADQLSAMGVRYLVLRNDLDTSLSRAPSPTVVHEALRGSTGLRLVADFGPLVGGQLDDGAVVDRGLSQPYRAIEVYEVVPYAGLVSTAPMDSVPVVVGGPENVVDLRDAGIIDAAPTLLDGDRVTEARGPVIQTDGIARRESTPGRVDDNASARLSIDEAGVLGRRLLDYTVFPDGRATAVPEWAGEGRITASSAASNVDSAGGTRRSASPAAALDGDLFASWWSSVGNDRSPWWQVSWETPRVLPALRLAVDQSFPGYRAGQLTISTENSSQTYEIPREGVIDIPAGSAPTTFLRVEASSSGGLGIREVLGLVPERRTVVTPEPSRSPDVTALAATVDGRPWCVHPPSAVICTDLIGRPGEDDGAVDRVAAIPAAVPADFRLEAVPRPGAALDELIAEADRSIDARMRASASSSGVADPEGGPRAAIDRDLETAWIADSSDDDPRLVLDWGEPRAVNGLRLRQRLGLPASRPLSVAVQLPDGQTITGRFDRNGTVLFDEKVVVSGLTVRFPDVQDVFSVDPATGGGVILPVGIADLRILGAADLQPDPAAAKSVTIPCGQGPAVSIGGALLETQGTTTLRDLVQLLPASFEPCGRGAAPGWDAETVRVLATGGDRWSVRGVVFGDVGRVNAAPEGPVQVLEWGSSLRQVSVPERSQPTLLVVRENANPGWSAWLDGQPLAPARPDGWQQGWILPPGAQGVVELRMEANGIYLLALAAGLASAVALVCAAAVSVWARRRARPMPPIAPAHVRAGALWGIVGVGLTFSAGVWGASATLVAWVFATWIPDRWIGARAAAVFCLAALSGAVLAWGPWPGDYAGDSWAAAVPLTLAIALAVGPVGGRRKRAASGASPARDT